VKSHIYQIASILTIVLSLVPTLIVSVKKLWRATPFQLFALYWMLNGMINVVVLSRLFDKATLEKIIVVYNALDVPIMACALYLSTTSVRLRKLMRTGFGAFVAYELFCLARYGLHYEALKYAMGIGVIMLMVVIVWQIVLFLRQMEYATREKALLYILGSLLFQYGMYLVVYVFDYFMEEIPDHVDKFLIYYTASIISLTIANCGLLLKGLQRKPDPPPNTRGELRKSFLGQFREKTAQ
jgi:hypothetical protein